MIVIVILQVLWRVAETEACNARHGTSGLRRVSFLTVTLLLAYAGVSVVYLVIMKYHVNFATDAVDQCKSFSYNVSVSKHGNLHPLSLIPKSLLYFIVQPAVIATYVTLRELILNTADLVFVRWIGDILVNRNWSWKLARPEKKRHTLINIRSKNFILVCKIMYTFHFDLGKLWYCDSNCRI